MSSISPTSRRTIALVGHGGAGKTALAEALLFSAGATTRIGKTVDGSSHFDFEPEEIKRGSTMKAAVYDFSTKQNSITLIDTPGSSSFMADVICAVRAADVSLLVASAVSGVKVQGEKAWNASVREGLARAVFVNELDKERAVLETAIQSLKTNLEIEPVVLQIPIGAEAELRGVIDLVDMKAHIKAENGSTSVEDVPEELRADAEKAREALIERVAETEDSLTEKYLEGEELSHDEIVAALKSCFHKGELVPVFCGSAETAVGVGPLQEVIAEYFPSPLERVPYLSVAEDGSTTEIEISENGPFCAFVFKTFADPYTGQVTLIRVLSGVLQSDHSAFNVNRDHAERLGKLHIQQGKEHDSIDSAVPGQIVALSKLKDTRTGDTLCDETAPLRVRRLELPESCISFAVEPKSKGDEDKIISAIEKMSMEDPCISLRRDPSTHETLISGMGQDHVDITVQRIARKFKVEMVLHAPQVPYRETIRGKAEAQGKHKKQSGGRGQFGDCWLKIAARAHGAGFEFKNEIFGGAIPRNYIPAVEKGVIEAMEQGCLAGFPMVDIECTVYDGSYHNVDSSDMAFKLAALKGFRAAVEKASPVLLEPVMTCEIIIPDECTGDVIGDLNSRRGKVLNMEPKGHNQIIAAEVPLSEMLTYAPQLRSITADRGTFHMEFHGYEETPAHVADKVIKEFKKAKGGAEGD